MSAARHLREQSPVERRDALEELIVARIMRDLSMGDDEELPLDRSYFDLGLTSLVLTEIRDYLQQELEISIDATVMFNLPTVEHLVDHLAELLAAPENRENTDAA